MPDWDVEYASRLWYLSSPCLPKESLMSTRITHDIFQTASSLTLNNAAHVLEAIHRLLKYECLKSVFSFQRDI